MRLFRVRLEIQDDGSILGSVELHREGYADIGGRGLGSFVVQKCPVLVNEDFAPKAGFEEAILEGVGIVPAGTQNGQAQIVRFGRAALVLESDRAFRRGQRESWHRFLAMSDLKDLAR